jgi:hypothetical protein
VTLAGSFLILLAVVTATITASLSLSGIVSRYVWQGATSARIGKDGNMWRAVFVGDKDHDAWALVDDNGDEREPSYWYYSRQEAEAAAARLGMKG